MARHATNPSKKQFRRENTENYGLFTPEWAEPLSTVPVRAEKVTMGEAGNASLMLLQLPHQAPTTPKPGPHRWVLTIFSRGFPVLSRFFRGEIPSFSVFFRSEYFTRQS
jgi:hypothetical protein